MATPDEKHAGGATLSQRTVKHCYNDLQNSYNINIDSLFEKLEEHKLLTSQIRRNLCNNASSERDKISQFLDYFSNENNSDFIGELIQCFRENEVADHARVADRLDEARQRVQSCSEVPSLHPSYVVRADRGAEIDNRESDDSGSEEGTDDPAAPLNPQRHNIPTFWGLFQGACPKKLMCCCGLLPFIVVVCIGLIVAGTVTPHYVAMSAKHGLNPNTLSTMFNTTVVVPLPSYTKTVTTLSNHDKYSECTVTAVALPCRSLNANFKENQTEDEIPNDGRYYIYLLRGSVFHFQYKNTSLCPSYILWIFSSMVPRFEPNDIVSEHTECNSHNEQRLNARCNNFSQDSYKFDYPVPKDSFYFYTAFSCGDISRDITWTVDYRWYNFSQYVDKLDVPSKVVQIPPQESQEISVSNSFKESCILINTPSDSTGARDCGNRNNPKPSSVTILDVEVDKALWLVFTIPFICSAVVFCISTLIVSVCCIYKAVNNTRRECQVLRPFSQ